MRLLTHFPTVDGLQDLAARTRRPVLEAHLEKANRYLGERRRETGQITIQFAEKALKISPFAVEAWVALASNMSFDGPQSRELLERGVAAGALVLGEAFIEAEKGYFWDIPKTRPYMLALHGLALCLREAGHRTDSIPLLERMITLNARDNFGVRDLLATDYLFDGRDADFEDLIARFPDDSSTGLMYGRILQALWQDTSEARMTEMLSLACKYSPHVISGLAGQALVPDENVHGIPAGGTTEAIHYLAEAGKLWARHPKEKTWLVQEGRAMLERLEGAVGPQVA